MRLGLAEYFIPPGFSSFLNERQLTEAGNTFEHQKGLIWYVDEA